VKPCQRKRLVIDKDKVYALLILTAAAADREMFFKKSRRMFWHLVRVKNKFGIYSDSKLPLMVSVNVRVRVCVCFCAYVCVRV